MTTRFNTDGYLEAVVGQRGLSGTNPISATMLYAKGGLFGAVVDKPAETAMSKGIEVKGDTDKVIDAELDRLKVISAITEALCWTRLFGGAAIIPIMDDGLLNTPINYDSIGHIAELKVFDIEQISALPAKYMDPKKANFGMPIYYEIDVGNGARFVCHESRLIEMGGDILPRSYRQSSALLPWAGRSAVGEAYRITLDYLESLAMAKNILKRKQQGVHQMTGLAEAIEAGLEATVQKRVGLVDQARGILNTVVVDKEDAFTVQDSNLSGIKEVIHEFQVALSAATSIPVTILFGRSPGGLNSTGEADFDTYHDMVEGIRKNKAQPVLERLISLILAQKSLPQKKPDDWFIVWPSLKQLSEKETEEVEKTRAATLLDKINALDRAVGTGALSERQALEYLESEALFGLESPGQSGAGASRYASQT